MNPFSRFARALLLILPLAAGPRALAQEMPLEIHARYWESPGPEQSEEGAPKLLIMYPVKEGDPTDSKSARYAGRVEPEDAKVTLNGEELKVYPGGVFTGLQAIEDDDKDFVQVWKFEASAAGKKTDVRRTLKLQKPPVSPKAWPLVFFSSAVSPTGDFVLPDGKTLDVKLYGSPGAKAEYRIGEGSWQAMDDGEADAKRGAVYKATLTPPVVDARGPQKVSFRLTSEHEGETKTITKDPGLRVAMAAPGAVYAGVITQYVATYLKEPEGWNRWGNWIEGTRFPVLEVRGDRARTDFGTGGDESKGWLELIHSKIDWTSTGATGLVELGAPNKSFRTQIAAQTTAWHWNTLTQPVATVFNYEPSGLGNGRLTITQPGGKVTGENLATWASKLGESPKMEIDLDKVNGPLWGFGMGVDENGFYVAYRTRPDLDHATPENPLARLRIMIDAGHGGNDVGALGPSGITESDLNLVEAAWLEKYLTEMGAQVEQVRRSDVKVELDERCKMAIDWDPDLFVSLHHNSVGFGSDPLHDSGPIVFFHYPHSEPLAKAIAEPLAEAFGAGKGARTKAENFRVNRNFNLCPSVLVETAYVCNPEDDFKLRKTETTKRNAKAIAEGIKAYMAETQAQAEKAETK